MGAARPKAVAGGAEAAPPPSGSDLVAGPAMRAKLAKIGIRTRFDLVLHLPLRYEDETRLTPLARAGTGEPVLVEAVVVECEVKYRPRRTLVVKLTDGASELWVRFLNFYPSQVKQMAAGRRLRLEARRELHRGGVEPDLPGEIHGVAGAHGLRVGPDGGGRMAGRYGLLAHRGMDPWRSRETGSCAFFSRERRTTSGMRRMRRKTCARCMRLLTWMVKTMVV